jgi:cysteinyl-tRNA synthetase
MALAIYNTLSKTKEPLKPLSGNQVRIRLRHDCL